MVKFSLRGQELTALRGVSMELYKGESLAIVGESGSGKSVFCKSFIGMLDKNGWVESGEIWYNGTDIAKYKKDEDWIKIRGKEIAIVFQDPMTSLNPLQTVGTQIREALELHQGLKVLEVYDPSIHNYTVDKPSWVEIRPKHYITCNKHELEQYQETLARAGKEG